jgi:uncharacterized membrane protein
LNKTPRQIGRVTSPAHWPTSGHLQETADFFPFNRRHTSCSCTAVVKAIAKAKKAVTMTSTTQEHSVVAIYETHTGAEAALKELQKAGLDMKRLSIIGQDFHTEEHATGFYTSGDRMKFWGVRGAFWGSLWGVLFGGAFFFIPVLGPLVVMGPLVGWLVGALEGAALGGAAGVLAAALGSIGIPNDSIVKYELDVKAGKFLVLARGTPEMISHAHVVLGTTGASLLAKHTG